MTVLLLEPFGGLAGDMLLAALLDLRDPRFDLAGLRALAGRLVGDEARLEATETTRGWLRATHLAVRTPESARAPHRHLSDLLGLLERAELSAAARARAAAVLRRLGEAEAEVHAIPLDRVHFHEVGAVAPLVVVGGAVWALERLGVTRVHATPPLVGSGTVRCAHGVLPVPAPATAILLRGMPHVRGGAGERLTPTGAALLAELADSFAEVPGPIRVEREGYGAGTADPPDAGGGPPNLVRAALCGSPAAGDAGNGCSAEAWLLEVTLDDATGEELGFVLEELYGAGALEAWTHPVTMKKGRPGVVLSALCRAAARAELERVLFEHTPTLGVRWSLRERSECARETVAVDLDGERIAVKVRRRPGIGLPRPEDFSPEHDDLARAARATGRTLRALEREAVELARRAYRANT
jgi:uncharacterized protein (TIGR00299 family) protein